ncbi:hypothetical protein NG895_12545 [Aeoliella sp. ICT_H6.2]|uniref:Glycosyltransferase family 1 protein n=1 Tax=Aeoliella straminimaris TaxID=2954799 RepID=A0A9X2FAP7_9BACT|nr:hypothetical protein [Aeoliella straminimaris]MCO6044738.1 hypothetical protein [Aeoliella straminimaris]
MARIVVAGYMIRLPLAGNILAFAQYLRGLELLGHEVLYVEESGWPDSCYEPLANCYSSCPVAGMDATKDLLATIDCRCTISYVDSTHQVGYGVDRLDIRRFIQNADLVINLGGVNWLEEFAEAQHVVLVDMDPMFTQIGSFAKEGFDRYNICFTYGTNVGRPDCDVPAADVEWVPIVPPVIPELWSSLPCPTAEPVFSTVANWSAYGDVEWNGIRYGQKGEEFLKMQQLPRLVDAKLRIATSGMPRRIAAQFREFNWEIVDGQHTSLNLSTYQSYIADSSGEFSVAKNGYVKARTGWISDRTVCYLAAGRPAILQDTGVPDPLRGLPGWNTFDTVEEAAEAINRVTRDWHHERSRAQQLARERFDYRVVLPELVHRALEAA